MVTEDQESKLFQNWRAAVEFSTNLRFREKQEIRAAITDYGGTVSYIINKKCSCLIATDPNNVDTYKCRTALKLGIPVVSLDFLWLSIRNGKLCCYDDHRVAGETKCDIFSKGKIAVSSLQSEKVSRPHYSIIDPAKVKGWKWGDNKAPYFMEDKYLIAKCNILRQESADKGSTKLAFCVLELHASLTKDAETCYRVFCQTGFIAAKVTVESTEVFHATTADHMLCVYNYLYKKKTTAGFKDVELLPSFEIGSPQFRKSPSDWIKTEDDNLSLEVKTLVQHLWAEAVGHLENTLAQPIDCVKIDKVEKAEGILLQIKTCLKEGKTVASLSDDFYKTVPHVNSCAEPIVSIKILAQKQDFCQLLRDILSVSEATDWSVRSSVLSKYKALRCNIVDLGNNNEEEFDSVAELITKNTSDKNRCIKVKNIYKVHRSVESLKFDSNRRLLFHATQVKNVVGILSRGLLLPKVVVDDHGGVRTDAGMLGSGIYFTDDVSTSVKYSKPSSTVGSRMLLVSEVALGRCREYWKYHTTLTAPPEGYDSVHGVKQSSEKGIDSDFQDDEYVIYDVRQQSLKYLVEFSLAEDPTLHPMHILVDAESPALEDAECTDVASEVTSITDLCDPLTKVAPGLLSKSDTPVPLKSVCVQAHLKDLAAEVVVLQAYVNTNNVAIEAKYVFPLDEMAAVCGFEAFINGKHIVGEVKEKETAHREYKEAIREGHGAYLMDQDEETPDVFTVSVGNLPPQASVLIKITYVTELQVDGDKIVFNVPGSIAPWRKDANLAEITQTDVDTLHIKDNISDNLSVRVNIEMPFDIRSIESPSHKIRTKKTATKAVVEMGKNQQLEDGFQLCVGLAEIHMPRMWVEQDVDDSDHQACMLTFYPEFEASQIISYEAVFILDASNSMRGQPLKEAKAVLILAIQKLPSTCTFNVLAFGNSFEECFILPQKKTKGNMEKALHFIKKTKATRGNTELVLPLQSLFLLPLSQGIRNVILFSDGHFSNSDRILKASASNKSHTRVFPCGFGSSPNRYLLRTLARVSGGFYEYFDSKTKSKWERKVVSQLEKSAQPGLSSVSVDWETHGAEGEYIQAPSLVTALFNGSRLVVYGFIPNCTKATLKAEIDGQEVSTMVSTHELQVSRGKILHRLAAKAIIHDWKDGTLSSERSEHEAVKMKRQLSIVNISKKYSIVTQFTSFIAVERRDQHETFDQGPSMQELIDRERSDILDYIGWDTETPVDMMVATDISLEMVHGRIDKFDTLPKAISIKWGEESLGSDEESLGSDEENLGSDEFGLFGEDMCRQVYANISVGYGDTYVCEYLSMDDDNTYGIEGFVSSPSVHEVSSLLRPLPLPGSMRGGGPSSALDTLPKEFIKRGYDGESLYESFGDDMGCEVYDDIYDGRDFSIDEDNTYGSDDFESPRSVHEVSSPLRPLPLPGSMRGGGPSRALGIPRVMSLSMGDTDNSAPPRLPAHDEIVWGTDRSPQLPLRPHVCKKRTAVTGPPPPQEVVHQKKPHAMHSRDHAPLPSSAPPPPPPPLASPLPPPCRSVRLERKPSQPPTGAQQFGAMHRPGPPPPGSVHGGGPLPSPAVSHQIGAEDRAAPQLLYGLCAAAPKPPKASSIHRDKLSRPILLHKQPVSKLAKRIAPTSSPPPLAVPRLPSQTYSMSKPIAPLPQRRAMVASYTASEPLLVADEEIEPYSLSEPLEIKERTEISHLGQSTGAQEKYVEVSTLSSSEGRQWSSYLSTSKRGKPRASSKKLEHSIKGAVSETLPSAEENKGGEISSKMRAFSKPPCNAPLAPPSVKIVHKDYETRTSLHRMILSNPRFSFLNESTMSLLIDHLRPVYKKAGYKVVCLSKHYIIGKGAVEVQADTSPAVVLTAGDSFGIEREWPFSLPCSCEPTFLTLTDTELWVIEGDFLHYLLDYCMWYYTEMPKRECVNQGLISCVNNMQCLKSLSDIARQLLVSTLTLATFSCGDVIVNQEEPGSRFYVVIEGEAVVSQQSQDDCQPTDVGCLKANDYFGEVSLLYHQPRSATVTVKSDTLTCAWLDSQRFGHLLRPCFPFFEKQTSQYKNLVPVGTKRDGSSLYEKWQRWSLEETIILDKYCNRLELSDDVLAMAKALNECNSDADFQTVGNTWLTVCEILNSAGVKSLGLRAEIEVKRCLSVLLMATALLRMYKTIVFIFPLDHRRNLIDELESSLSVDSTWLRRHELLKILRDCLTRLHTQYGSLYSNLELGLSWTQVITRICLSVVHIGVGNNWEFK